MSKEVPYHFKPDVFFWLYLIRKNLYNGINKHAPALTGRMMDFGCGEKPYQSLFVNVSEYIGVDYNGDGHDHSEEQIDVFYDGKTIPFPDNHFDSVLSTEVFEHIFNLEEILKEVHRVMKPGGKLLFTCPFTWLLHEEPVDFARYTPYAIRHIFEKAGFRIVALEKAGNSLETLAQIKIVLGLNYLLYNRISRKLYVGKLLNGMFILYNNLKTNLKSRMGFIYKKKDYLYLNNIVLVEKV